MIGVLEANFIEPTHNKQDFEKTPVFLKLEARLKDMTLEYWLVITFEEKKFRSKVASSIICATMNLVIEIF